MRRRTLHILAVASWLFIALLCAGTAEAASPEIRATVAMQKSGSEATLLGMFFHDPRLGWAVGSGGTILKTTDGGRKWKKVSSGTTSLLTAVYFQDARRGWVVGANGTVRTSRDGGETWSVVFVSTQAPLYGIAFVTPQKGWLVGGNGTILQTTDGGKNWTDQASGTSAALHSIVLTNQQHGTIVGALGTILTTSDGGVTWTPQVSQSSTTFFDVAFADEANGWAVGNAGALFQTTDGKIEKPEDVAAYKVGVQTGTTQDTWLTDNLVAKGLLKEENLFRYDRVDQAMLDLQNGRIDIMMSDYIPAQALVKQLGGLNIVYHGVLSTGPVNIVLPEGDQELQAINDAIAKLQSEGFIDALAGKYFAQ